MDKSAIMVAMQNGKLDLQGQFVRSSNYTYLAQLEYGTQTFKVVYKPTRGERPLWDFPTATLTKREVAAYLVSEALGWELIPPTLYRRKAPMGPGSLQQYIEHDPTCHYFSISNVEKQRLRPTVAFDVIINNADRKGSHIIFDQDQHIWLIDHGVCFHKEDKLRTVIWDFAGETIPNIVNEGLHHLFDQLKPGDDLFIQLSKLIKVSEIQFLAKRTQKLIDTGIFPIPPEDRRVYPWPPI